MHIKLFNFEIITITIKRHGNVITGRKLVMCLLQRDKFILP